MQCGQDEACLQQLIRTARFVNDKSARLLYSSRGHQFDEALGQFFADILAVCARTESRVNHIHLTAILGGLAKAWATAKACHVVHNHQQAGNDLHRFTAKILEMLQPLCKTLGVREASSLLSSLSKLNTDPGLLVPGTLDAIVQQLMANMHSANGQDLADVTAALTMLQSTPCYKDLMLAVSSQLAGGGLSNADSTRVASILHSLATTPSAAHSTKALNALCERFSVQLRSHRLADLPYANSIAIVMWALSKLKHAPSNELAMSMVGRMADLCRSPKQQPLPQAISNVLLACAELRISVKQADIDSLVCTLLGKQQPQGDKQHCTITAWSLAVLGCLHSHQLDKLIDQLVVLSTKHGKILMPLPRKDAELRRLYQALDWLQPPASAHSARPCPACKGSCTDWEQGLRPPSAISAMMASCAAP